jgi:hypothetical protein
MITYRNLYQAVGANVNRSDLKNPAESEYGRNSLPVRLSGGNRADCFATPSRVSGKPYEACATFPELSGKPYEACATFPGVSGKPYEACATFSGGSGETCDVGLYIIYTVNRQ